METRLTDAQKGIQLYAERGDEIAPLGGGWYEVPGQGGRGPYSVNLDVLADNPLETCECPHFEHRLRWLPVPGTCKHIHAATMYRAAERVAKRRARELEVSIRKNVNDVLKEIAAA